MKIILLGAHGTGKTTLATSLSEKYGWPIIESPSRIIHDIPGLTPEQYQEIITRMNMKTWDDVSHYSDITLFCRTLIDNLSYNPLMVGWDKGILQNLTSYKEYRWMLEHMNTKDDIVVIRIPIEFAMEKDGVRPESEEYRELIDKRQEDILQFLIKDGIIKEENVCRVTGSNDERVSRVCKFLRNWLTKPWYPEMSKC